VKEEVDIPAHAGTGQMKMKQEQKISHYQCNNEFWKELLTKRFNKLLTMAMAVCDLHFVIEN